jgi:hypothetical protein
MANPFTAGVTPQNPYAYWNPLRPVQGLYNYLAGAGRNPQQPDEDNIVYGARRLIGSPFTALQDLEVGTQADLAATAKNAFTSPNEAKARQQQQQRQQGTGSMAFPQKFNDPAYGRYEQEASQITGVPMELLQRIRLLGERSNAGAVSSAGARTPYQVTPETRQGLIKNYKVDPWKDPRSAALGAAYVLWEQAGRPGPGRWGPQQIQRAAGGYFGGAAGANNPFGSLSDGGTTVGEYTQRVLGPNTGLAAPFVAPNPMNPFQGEALQTLGQAEALAKQPFSTTIERPPMPEMPAPTPVPKTDFTASDEALQALRPEEMAEADKIKMQRRGWLSGLGQALMSMPEGASIGTIIARAGGAMLAGRGAADEEIMRRQDVFEQKMAQFNTAVFNNELNKAQVHSREAQAEADKMDRFALNAWQTNVQQWRADNNVSMQGDALVATSADANGNLTVNRIPVGPAVAASFALRRAEMYSGLGGQFNAGQYMIAQANNSLVGAAAAQQMATSMAAGNGEESAAAVAAAPATYATFVAQTGKVADVVGAEGATSLYERVDQRLQQMGMLPGTKDYTERKDFMVAEELANLAIMDPQYMAKLQSAGRASDLFNAAERYQGRRERVGVDARGRRTSSVTYDNSNELGQ